MQKLKITNKVISNDYYLPIGVYFKNKDILNLLGIHCIKELILAQKDIINRDIIRIGYTGEGILWKNREWTLKEIQEYEDTWDDIYEKSSPRYYSSRIEFNEIDKDNDSILVGKCFHGESDDSNFIEFDKSENIVYHRHDKSLTIID